MPKKAPRNRVSLSSATVVRRSTAAPPPSLLAASLYLLLTYLVLFGASGCTKPPAQPVVPTRDGSQTSVKAPTLSFHDVTAESGLNFIYRNGREANVFSIVESLGGGVGILDSDGDGLLDLFFPGGGSLAPGQSIGGRPPALYRQIARWRFQDVSELADVNQSANYTHGCSIADYDNDGFQDILVTGYGGLQLFHNLGDGTFLENHESVGLTDKQWSSSAGWGDFNGDGSVDVYVAHYVDWSWKNNPPCILPKSGKQDVCPPREFRGLDDVIYFSNGDGTFRDGTKEAQLRAEGKGLGVLLADVDADSDLDIYVANDTTDNFLYINNGSGVFEEVGTVSGVATDDRGAPNGSMGVALLDYNQDAQADIWVANFENESFALYRNEGNGAFTHASQAAGIHALGSFYVGFGTAAGDFDRDGDEDLVVSNGHVVYHPTSGQVRQPPLLLLNEKGRFRRVDFNATEYFGAPHYGRGLAVGDLDDDGDLDCVFANNNEPSAVVRNEGPAAGSWLGAQLIGTRSDRNAIGAVAVLRTTRGDQMRQVSGGGSYLSQHDARLFWGLAPGDTPTSLTIRWPSGQTQEVSIDQPAKYLRIIEP